MGFLNLEFSVDSKSLEWLERYSKRTGKSLTDAVEEAVWNHSRACASRFYGLFEDYLGDRDEFFFDMYDYIDYVYVGCESFSGMYLVKATDDEDEPLVALFFHDDDLDLMVELCSATYDSPLGVFIINTYDLWRECFLEHRNYIKGKYFEQSGV